ncbi:hypothetical protein B0T21DRAFT_384676 [Apiosordaria backusii]|uniref:Cellobiose dehydrogenase-like cytochrome domain-containing protein n=1 Tax=Apiosordaria backusii TaxID=314023 RepID=A0AA40BDQ0_9PEZI|nr:hypothetical protein B0T21DRAFT_384676 [Apiosordaria backusii]
MHLSSLIALLSAPLLATSSPLSSSSSSSEIEPRQVYGVTSKYCSTASGNVPSLCFLQYYISATAPTFRVALPSDATNNAAYDTILQIISPITQTWVGFAWGGGMTNNPLTVAWPNGNQGQVGRTLPGIYSSATLRTLSTARNSTHWTVEVVCTGCSRWNSQQNGGRLETQAGSASTFAWAISRTAVPQPSNPSGSFPVHNNQGMFSNALDFGKNARATFTQYVQNKRS